MRKKTEKAGKFSGSTGRFQGDPGLAARPHRAAASPRPREAHRRPTAHDPAAAANTATPPHTAARLAQSARATNRANLRVVVLWHAGPPRRLSPVRWPNLSAVIDAAKLRGGRDRCPRSELSKGRPGVIGHRQPPIPRRCPERLDVHPRPAARARVTAGTRDHHDAWRAPARVRASSAASPAARHPTSGTTRETHQAWPRTPPAIDPTRSGTHAACGAPRRHTMPSAPGCREARSWRWAYFSQPIFRADRSLCSPHIRRGSRERGRNHHLIFDHSLNIARRSFMSKNR